MSMFTDEQIGVLLRPIHPGRIAKLDGMSHLEGYDVRATLTRMFGFGMWDEIASEPTELLYSIETTTKAGKPAVKVAYRAARRLTIRSANGGECVRVVTDHCDIARAAARQYGANLHATRQAACVSLRELSERTGIDPPALSRFERGTSIPDETEQARLYDWASRIPGSPLVTPVVGQDDVGARATDPQQSHDTSRSIADDTALADKILFIAEQLGVPFDDTDLTTEMQRYWPRPIHRPWQRNVIARARGLIGTMLTTDPTTGKRVRVPAPDCPLQHVGTIERTRDGRTRPTEHFQLRKDVSE